MNRQLKDKDYKRSDRANDGILVRVEDLVFYLFNATNNSKLFPKQYRYNIINDIRVNSLRLYHAIYAALSIHPKHKKAAKRARRKQQEAYDAFTDLKASILIASKIPDIEFRNNNYIGILLTDVSENYNKWIKNTNRNYKKLPTKKQYEERRLEAARKAREQAKTQANWNAIPRDKDGFIQIFAHSTVDAANNTIG